MALTEAARTELSRLGIEGVKMKLAYAGAGSGSSVPGICSPDPIRLEVENWLFAEIARVDREATKDRSATLWWAKAATWIGGLGIVVAIAIALAGR
jgi:hypothetical protein